MERNTYAIPLKDYVRPEDVPDIMEQIEAELRGFGVFTEPLEKRNGTIIYSGTSLHPVIIDRIERLYGIDSETGVTEQ